MSKNECDHTIAFEYGEEYGANSGNAIYLSDLKYDLSYEKKLKTDDLYSCNYCPDCGIQLESIIEKTIKDTKEERRKRDEKEKRERKKKEKAFNDKVQNIKEKTKLNTLEENKNYYVSFASINEYDTRDYVLTGTPEHIARNITHHLKGKELPLGFKFKKVVLCPSKEEFNEACKEAGWNINERDVSKLNDKGYQENLDYTEEGMVYTSSFHIDDKSDKSYDRFSIVYLIDNYDINLTLNEIEL